MPAITSRHTPQDIRHLAMHIKAAAALRPVRIYCGSGHHYGICPVCKRGHGWQVFQQKRP